MNIPMQCTLCTCVKAACLFISLFFFKPAIFLNQIMIQLQLQSHGSSLPFSFPESARETTLGTYIAYKTTVEAHKPKSLSDYEEADYDSAILEALPLKEITEAWPAYYISFISFWAGIPSDVLALTALHEVTALYKLITVSVAAFDQQSQQLSFTHQGQQYLYPSQGTNAISGQIEYLRSASVLEVVEAMQFEEQYGKLKEGYWSALPFIIAILCRRAGEQLPLDAVAREAFLAERAQLFHSLPLQEALNVAFFLPASRHSAANGGSPYSIQPQGESPLPQAKNTGVNMDGTSTWKALQKVVSSPCQALRKCKARWQQTFTRPSIG